ncbi:MAG: glycosyl transferase [Verrucomicrobiales bacterium]|nr:glycosyl transferase [Verrucomicrobiales bacterium]
MSTSVGRPQKRIPKRYSLPGDFCPKPSETLEYGAVLFCLAFSWVPHWDGWSAHPCANVLCRWKASFLGDSFSSPQAHTKWSPVSFSPPHSSFSSPSPSPDQVFSSSSRKNRKRKPKAPNPINITTKMASKVKRLAVVISHPIQYYSPWFRHLANRDELKLKVFYLWDFGVKETTDEKFGTSFSWDIPLLDGYNSEFLKNQSKDPGTHHFRGLDNRGAVAAISNWNPDSILIFGYNYATHLRIILSRQLRKVPMIFRGDSHNLFPTKGWKQKLSRNLRAMIFKRFQSFLSVGKANEEYFKSCGIKKKKLTRAYHCVDNDRFQDAAEEAEKAAKKWRKELGIPKKAFVFLSAGKFESKKRPLDLLAAFEKIDNPDCALLLIGGGEHEKQLKKTKDKRVFFAPFQNQSQMPKVYATGDIVMLPSHGRGETWGLAINEAMNLGRPAIVSSHVGCGPDLVIEGKTGWIFPAGDVKALRKAMEQALMNPEETREMGQRAQRKMDKFSYKAAGDALIQAIMK